MANYIMVKIAPLGKSVVEVTVEEGTTIRNAISAATTSGRTTVTGYEDLRRNSMPAKLDDIVKNGDIITLVPAIKGGKPPVVPATIVPATIVAKKEPVVIKTGRVYSHPFDE
jgi:sulfur carrier protein ThiS